MSLGENVHNAFAVVFETLKSIDNLMKKCRAELDESKYYMPEDRFLRWNSDSKWDGWIYWSFILLFQRMADGQKMNNGWINAPVYAVEINVNPETYEEPRLIIAKIKFSDMQDWQSGCSPSNHHLVYNAIHEEKFYKRESQKEDVVRIVATKGNEEKAENKFWGFKELYYVEHKLMDVNQDNYKHLIFGSIEKLSDIDW